MNNFPPWLKAGQNSSIGEIRTKSFLMDRFWVLERSVDIHGADFIIQRRLYEKNILDDQPTRFGVVQSKFSQNDRTNHNVKKEYILDKENKPRNEFFLIIHSGDEEVHKMFLLTSEDIVENFSLNENNEFPIITNRVFSSSKYQIFNRKLALDRIENSIQCAEFYKNRLYVFSKLSSSIPDFDAILPEYKENIEHWFGTVPEVFKEQKQKALEVVLQIEEVHKLYVEFLESVDPLEACCIAEKIEHEFGDYINLPDVFSKDFYYGARNHKKMVENMRNDGALDNYISARKTITNEINLFMQSQQKYTIDNDTFHEITVKYDPANLSFILLTNSLSQIPENNGHKDFYKFLVAKDGYIVLSWNIGLQFIHDGYVSMNGCCVNEIMERIYALKYYEGHEI